MCESCNDYNELKEEAATFNDILIINFIDSYHNLTTKTLTSLYWAYSRCSLVRFYVKVDDDVFVNTEKVLKELYSNVTKYQNLLSGDCPVHMGPNRDKMSKYYVSKEMYPEKLWPPFCFGTSYIVGNYSLASILKVVSSTPVVHLEDASMGILANATGTVHAFRIGKWRWTIRPKTKPFDYTGCPSTYTVHNISPDQIKQLWDFCTLLKPPGVL